VETSRELERRHILVGCMLARASPFDMVVAARLLKTQKTDAAAVARAIAIKEGNLRKDV